VSISDVCQIRATGFRLYYSQWEDIESVFTLEGILPPQTLQRYTFKQLTLSTRSHGGHAVMHVNVVRRTAQSVYTDSVARSLLGVNCREYIRTSTLVLQERFVYKKIIIIINNNNIR